MSGGPTAADDKLAAELSPKIQGDRVKGLDGGQLSCARVIVRTVRSRDLSERAAVIALTTAMSESTLHDLTEAVDHDSLGLFQQRPSSGWGTPEQITDPVYATNAFIDKMLEKFPNGAWESGDIGNICQTVQVSQFPGAYTPEVPGAQTIADALWDERSVAQGWGVFANGNFHLVEPGSSGRLYQITSPSAGPWSSWEDMGGSSVGTPAIINRGSMYDLFATNADGEVMQRHYADSAWGSWYHDATASGNVTAAKGSGVAAVYGLDAYRLFYVGPGGDLFQSWYNDGWHSQSLGGDFVGTPAAAVSGDQVKVFATNSSGQVYQRNYANGSWGGWYVDKTTSGPITAKAGTGVAAVHALGYDRLFYVGPGGDLFQSWYNDGWHSQSLGGSITGVPTVVMSGDDRMDVFGTSPAGGLFQRTSWAGGAWDSWHQIADKP